MRQELLDRLYQDYPPLFRKDITEVYVRDGWCPLINTLCSVLMDHLIYKVPEEAHNQIYISLIKEKFGTMRFHINHWDDFMMGAITMAEADTSDICEVCGHPGKIRNVKGWYQTLCEEDLVKEMEKR